MSASMKVKLLNYETMLTALVFNARTPEPVYVRPLRAPLRNEPMTLKQVLKFGEHVKLFTKREQTT